MALNIYKDRDVKKMGDGEFLLADGRLLVTIEGSEVNFRVINKTSGPGIETAVTMQAHQIRELLELLATHVF